MPKGIVDRCLFSRKEVNPRISVWKTTPKIMKIGLIVPKIFRKNISKFMKLTLHSFLWYGGKHENWSTHSWDIKEQHIQKSWKLVNSFHRYGGKTYPKIMKIGPLIPEILRNNISKNHENCSTHSLDIEEQHFQNSWKLVCSFLRYGGKTYPKIMKIGPLIPEILMNNISKNHENWSTYSWDIEEQHIQKSWKLVHSFLRYRGTTFPKFMKIGQLIS